MSAHMKMRHTEEGSSESLSLNSPKKSLPWRETAVDELEKYTEIGLMVRGGRLKAGLTQKELALLIEVKPHHISEMEHGKRTIGKAMARRLASIFKIDYRIFL